MNYLGNGDVSASYDSVNGGWQYSYDSLNRLTGASSNQLGNGFTYGYDAFGNRTQQNVTVGQGPQPQYSFSGPSNRIDGYSYDASGNLLNDGFHSYTYDAENRITQVDGGATATYAYDADGRRVKSQGTAYLYDLAGNAAVFINTANDSTDYMELYAGSRHLATYSFETTSFDHTDWLGNERARTGPTGLVTQTCSNLPFGDGQSCNGLDLSWKHFTGKERDSEDNLDYFGARYYSSTMGRWMSPDWADKPEAVPYADLSDPQSLNLYGYVRNNPMSKADADGHETAIVEDPQKALEFGARFGKTLQATQRVLSHPAVQAILMVAFFGAGGAEAGAVEGTASGAIKGTAEGTAASTDGALANRAQELQGTLSSRTQNSVTTAVGTARNADGTTTTLVSTSEGTLRSAQRGSLKPNETPVQGQAGTHAEVNMLNHANANGQTLETVAPSRSACASCQQTMQQNNVRIVTPPKKESQ